MENKEKIIKISLPLEVYISPKKKFILNLNEYRKAHWQLLSTAKKKYKELIWFTIPPQTIEPPYEFFYFLYMPHENVDAANPCSIIDKFTSDVLTEKGFIPDDKVKYLKSVKYDWGGIDKKNPRCDLYIRRRVKPSLAT